MSEYIKINNQAPVVSLWQQYRKNDTAVAFFEWVKTYWQAKYFNYVWEKVVPELSTKSGETDYLQFFALYWYGIIRPIDVTAAARYDTGLLYDSSDSVYDFRADSGPISLDRFRNIINSVLDWTVHDWNIPNLYKTIIEFTGLAGTAIAISQDATELDTFNISMTSTARSVLFKSLIDNYGFVWNLPFGIKLSITLV